MFARSASADRGLPDHGARDRLRERLHLHPRRVPATSSRCSSAALEEVRRPSSSAASRSSIHRGAGAYICGEETALLESLEGKRGQPRTKPPFPAIAGLYASPTLINNVETIATVPKIIELGGEEYAKIGVPHDSPGTRVFSLSGNVVNGGNYELPMGIDAAPADLRHSAAGSRTGAS